MGNTIWEGTDWTLKAARCTPIPKTKQKEICRNSVDAGGVDNGPDLVQMEDLIREKDSRVVEKK